ncbi:MAG: hypothetical protein CM15mP49_24690 [Actinomycetota bacterium]|nr:MAG: hypothetical protein CM15mP49_24690 [Actinomycetota bacterium]
MSWACGTNLEGSYLQMMMEELAPGDRDLRSPDWNVQDFSADRKFTVAIIGAGMSGILAAYRLKQAGVNFVLLKRTMARAAHGWKIHIPVAGLMFQTMSTRIHLCKSMIGLTITPLKMFY